MARLRAVFVTLVGAALSLTFATILAGAENKRDWQIGKVLDLQAFRSTAGKVVYETILIEGETRVYSVQEQLRGNILKLPTLAVNGPVKYVAEKRHLYLIDEDGEEHESEIVTQVLRNRPEPPNAPNSSVPAQSPAVRGENMKGENFLLAVARIALTFVGFASLVSLLRHGRHDWLIQEIRGLKLMFKYDLAATFFALLPFPLFYTIGAENERAMWRIASWLMTAFLVYALRSEIRLHRLNPKPRRPMLFRWLFVVPMFATIGIEVATGLFWPSVAGYAWGLFWLLIPPVVQFSIFISYFGVSQEGRDSEPTTRDEKAGGGVGSNECPPTDKLG
jgi:hypothetical protein